MDQNFQPAISGLSSTEVQKQLIAGKQNIQIDKTAKSVSDIIKENVFTYFNLIFAVLAVLVCLSGQFRNLTFLPVVIANMFIGIIQELRAKKVLDKLSVLSQPKTRVIRDGVEDCINTTDLVESDIILLQSGDQIPADAVVVDGNLNVNESLLTGESDEIEKQVGSELMSGSFVVSGSAMARLTKVGAQSYISKLTLEAKEMQGAEQSEMVKSINRFVIAAGIAIIPIGAALFIQGMMNENGFSASVSSMVAAVIGMIPEGLYLLVSVTLVVSATRLATKKVMLHDMKSIETLARVDVLCVDKTGTITEPEMKLTDIIDKGTTGSMEILKRYVSALPDNNITMEAIRDYLEVKQGNTGGILESMPFSSKYKYSGARFESGTYLMGAPDIILGERASETNEYTEQGKRVLVFASYNGFVPDGDLDPSRSEPLLYLLLENPIREGAEETFKYFGKQGVTIKVISGDHPVTVSRVAQRAGIEGADSYVDAQTLKDDAAIAKAVDTYTVFGRVTPDKKRQIVLALQDAGHTVAMTGDGVNDILAMKDADCSIAMASGSDAAVQAAQVALLDSDFSRMPQIVAEGRRVIGNIERSATLFLTKNMFSLLLAIFSIVSAMAYPLQPAQISLISGFNIGIPAFFLAMEPNKKRISGHFMAKVLLKAMPAALTDFLAISALVMVGDLFGLESGEIAVAATFLLAIVGFIILINISAPLNKYRVIVIIGCILGLVGCSFFLSNLFAISFLSPKCTIVFILFAIATEPCMRYLTMFFSWVERRISGKTVKRQVEDDE